MGPDLQIATNTSHRLLVSSPQMFFWSGTYLFVLVEVVLSVTVAKLLPASRGGLRSLFYLIPLTGIVTLFLAFGWTNTLDVDWDTGTFTYTNRSLLGYTTGQTLMRRNIDRAFLDYDRMGQRIALGLAGGGSVLPLGTISMYKPSQNIVVEALNSGLQGRTPDTPTGSSSSPASPAFDLGSGKMLQKQREFEQKLKDSKSTGAQP